MTTYTATPPITAKIEVRIPAPSKACTVTRTAVDPPGHSPSSCRPMAAPDTNKIGPMMGLLNNNPPRAASGTFSFNTEAQTPAAITPTPGSAPTSVPKENDSARWDGGP